MIRVWVGIVAIAGMVAGCGSTVIGTAVKAGPSDTGAGSAGPNPGNFPTKPRPPVATAGSPRDGALVEGRRMGENTILTYQLDPALINTGLIQGPYLNSHVLSNWFTDPISAAINDHNFVVGFMSAGDTEDKNPDTGLSSKELMNTVIRFATPDDATAAVQDMSAKSGVMTFTSSDSYPTHPVSIPRHPTTAAVGYTTASGTPDVMALTAHGPYVLGQWASGRSGPDDSQNLVAAVIDQQVPLIDAFVPTPIDQLASLPVDPTGMTFRTIAPGNGMVRAPGSYGPHGALAFQDNAAETKAIFDAAGVDVETFSRLNVLRARDSAGANKIVDGFADGMQRSHGYAPAGDIAGLPGSRCLAKQLALEKKKLFDHYCVAAVDRYTIEASDQHVEVVNQMVAAQYLMLKAH